MERKERTVIHLHLLKEDLHEYYGSLANVFEYHTPSELGVSWGTLRNYCITENKPYKNSVCIIRKGVLKQKAGERGRHKQMNTK